MLLGARAQRTRCASFVTRASSSSLARVTRVVPLKMITVSKGDRDADRLVARYNERSARYAPMEEIVVKQNPKNVKCAEAQKAHEGERVMKALTSRDYVVALDERGRDVSSEEFASIVAAIAERGYERGVFVMGGPYGHGEDVVKRANEKVRLSAMVLNHQVARVVLAEAVYRAHTILRGEPYHH